MQHAPQSQEAQPGQNLEMSEFIIGHPPFRFYFARFADADDGDEGLREHLLAAGASGSGPPPYPSNSAQPPPPPPPPPPDNPYQPSDSASPHEHYDPNVAQHTPYGMGGDPTSEDGTSPDVRKGKRELSTSKRAAQNRAAQRAFRQRKEGYIKKLEEQVRDFETMEQNYRALQNENYQLREYILNLQSRLLETSSDFPPAPSHANLRENAASEKGSAAPDRGDWSAVKGAGVDQQLRREMEMPPSSSHTSEPMRHDAMSQLQAAAAQASDARLADGQYAALVHPDSSNKRARADDPALGNKAG